MSGKERERERRKKRQRGGEGEREGGKERSNCMNHDTCRNREERRKGEYLHADKATTSSGMTLQHLNSFATPEIDTHGQGHHATASHEAGGIARGRSSSVEEEKCEN